MDGNIVLQTVCFLFQLDFACAMNLRKNSIFADFRSFWVFILNIRTGRLIRLFARNIFEVFPLFTRSWKPVIIHFRLGVTTFQSLAMEFLSKFQLSILEYGFSGTFDVIIESSQTFTTCSVQYVHTEIMTMRHGKLVLYLTIQYVMFVL